MDIFSQLITPADADSRFYGVAFAIVTNNKDPDGLGRVKLKLPWMADAAESDWARVVTPMAGAGRGFYCLPEVDDEVLVAFEHGSPVRRMCSAAYGMARISRLSPTPMVRITCARSNRVAGM